MSIRPLAPLFGITWEDERIGRPIKPIPSSAWVDPLGKFYAVPDCGHARWAEENFGTWNLEDKGWVHVSFGHCYYRTGRVRQAQIDTLFDALDVYVETGYEYAERFRQTVMDMLAEVD